MSKTKIKALLTDAFSPDLLEVVDDSHKHIGHAGAKQGSHFRVTIKSSVFDGKSHLEKHRMIYKALDPIKSTIHALAIKVLMLLLIAGFSDPANADLRNGLVGWWKFNEGSGTTVIDWSGNNNNGSFVNAPTWLSNCKRGGCIGFDGAANRYVNLGASTTFNTLQVPLTISGWFFKTSSSPSLQTIFGQYFATSGHNLLKLVRIDNGVLQYYAATSGGLFQHVGTFTPSLNVWHFFAVVVGGDVTSPTLSIYLDNQVESPALSSLSSSPSTSVSVYLGSNSAQSNEYFSGNLDDIRIYNRALSAQEIADLYRSGAVIKNAVIRNARINQ